jgi:hypothetical protein
MSDWAACLLEGRPGDIAALRLFPNVEFAEVGGAYWLRGGKLDADLELELKKIPGLARFDLLPAGRLRPVGSRIPDQTLPHVTWRPVRQAINVTMPAAALGGQTSQRIALTLTRTSQEQAALALSVTLDAWIAYATSAPAVRLASLRFAAMENHEVLLLGTPLPALPGRRFAGKEDILAPCGFTWAPAVAAAVLRRLFELRTGDLVVLAEDNTHQIIRAEQFVPASRSAARRTLAEWNHV